jgi:hypothetical protein
MISDKDHGSSSGASKNHNFTSQINFLHECCRNEGAGHRRIYQ